MIFDEAGRSARGTRGVSAHLREAYIGLDASDTRLSQTACELVDGAFISWAEAVTFVSMGRSACASRVTSTFRASHER